MVRRSVSVSTVKGAQVIANDTTSAGNAGFTATKWVAAAARRRDDCSVRPWTVGAHRKPREHDYEQVLYPDKDVQM